MQFIDGEHKSSAVFFRRLARYADQFGEIGFQVPTVGQPRLHLEIERDFESFVSEARRQQNGLAYAAIAIENQAARRASVADTIQCYNRILDQRGTTSEFGRESTSVWRKWVSASIHKQVSAVYRFSVNSPRRRGQI